MNSICLKIMYVRGGSRAAATSKMERSIFDVAAALDPPLYVLFMILIIAFVRASQQAAISAVYKVTFHILRSV